MKENRKKILLCFLAIGVVFLFIASAASTMPYAHNQTALSTNVSSNPKLAQTQLYSTYQPSFLSASKTKSKSDSASSLTEAGMSNIPKEFGSVELTKVNSSKTVPAVPDGIYYSSVTYSLSAALNGTTVSGGALTLKIEWEDFGHGYIVVGGSASLSWTYDVSFRSPLVSISATLKDSNGFSWDIPVTSSGSFTGTDSSFVNPTTTISLDMTMKFGPFGSYFDEYYLILTISGSTTINLD
jgi:hypothetical protein